MQCLETQTVPAPMEQLPLHILESICEHVAEHGRGQRSLHAFSLSSRLCCLAATPQRFARLWLSITDKHKLHNDLHQWIQVLSIDNRFRHVRRVTVVGFMPDDSQEKWTNGWGNINVTRDDYDIDEYTPSCASAITSMFEPSKPLLTPKHKQVQHGAWMPFAEFLGRLPALTDLVYVCTHQLPACVLQALHRHHPRSRLHVHAFSLRSAYQDRDAPPQDLDPDEFALATSPCLYSISSQCEPDDGVGDVAHIPDVIARMLSDYAPALRRVRVNYPIPGYSPALLQAVRFPRPTSQGRFPAASSGEAVATPRPRRLDTLILSRCNGFAAWGELVDLGLLRRLELSWACSLETLSSLCRMARNNRFHSLRQLGLALSLQRQHTADSQIASLLLVMPPLEDLKISDIPGDQTFGAVVQRHGQTLRRLALLPGRVCRFSLGLDGVRAIHQRCHNLEEIEIPLRRFQGRPEEVTMYRTLGRLPRLREAKLRLDCRLCDPGQDRRQNMRDALINSAVDATLAWAIFRQLSAMPSSALERLKIVPELYVGGFSLGSDFDALSRWIRRGWICTRYGTEVTVRELRLLPKMLAERLKERLESGLGDEERASWSELWPRRTDNWMDDWASFPLSEPGLDGT